MQLIFWVLKLCTADVLVSSALPANSSNFSGTVLPPLTVLKTPPMSTGW